MDPQLQAPRTGTPARTPLAPPRSYSPANTRPPKAVGPALDNCPPRPGLTHLEELVLPREAHPTRRKAEGGGPGRGVPLHGERLTCPGPRQQAGVQRGRQLHPGAPAKPRAAGTGRDAAALPLPSRAAPRLSAGRAEAAAVSAGWASATLGAAGPFLRPDAQPAPWRVVRPRFRPQAGPPCPSQTLVARPPRPHRPRLPPGGSGGSSSAPDQPPAGAKAAFGKLAFRLTRLRFKAFGGFPRPPCSGPPRPIGPACAACLLHPGTLRGPGRCAGCSGARRGNREVPAARRDGRAPGGAAT